MNGSWSTIQMISIQETEGDEEEDSESLCTERDNTKEPDQG